MNNLIKTDLINCYNTILAFRLLTNQKIGQTFDTHDSTTVIALADEYKNSRAFDLSLCSQNDTVESIHNNAIIESFDCVYDDCELGFAIVDDTMYLTIRHA